jgi:hypothetical protein
MKAQAKKLIAYLKRTNKAANLHYYNGSKTYSWQYYYTISGWFEGDYFCLYFFKSKSDDKCQNQIASTSDCVEKMQNLFNKYSLDETRQ